MTVAPSVVNGPVIRQPEGICASGALVTTIVLTAVEILRFKSTRSRLWRWVFSLTARG
jgi:hypothetical protein